MAGGQAANVGVECEEAAVPAQTAVASAVVVVASADCGQVILSFG